MCGVRCNVEAECSSVAKGKRSVATCEGLTLLVLGKRHQSIHCDQKHKRVECKSYRGRASARRRDRRTKQTIAYTKGGWACQHKEQHCRVQRVLEFQTFGQCHFYLANKKLPCRPGELDQIGLRNNQCICARRTGLRTAHHATQHTATTQRRHLRKSFWVRTVHDKRSGNIASWGRLSACQIRHVRHLKKGIVRNLPALVVWSRASQCRIQLGLSLELDKASVLGRRASRHCVKPRRLSVQYRPRPSSFRVSQSRTRPSLLPRSATPSMPLQPKTLPLDVRPPHSMRNGDWTTHSIERHFLRTVYDRMQHREGSAFIENERVCS